MLKTEHGDYDLSRAGVSRSAAIFSLALLCYILIAADIVPGISGNQAEYEPGYLDVINIETAGDVLRQWMLAPFFAGSIYLLVRHDFREKLRALGWPAGIIIAVCFMSAAWSSDAPATLRKALGLLGTFAVGTYVAGRAGPERFVRILQVSVMVALLGSFAWMLVAPAKALDTAGQLRGLFSHKNILGQFAGIGYVAFLSSAIREAGRRRRLHVFGAAICLIALALSRSATPVIAIGFVTAWVYGRARLKLRPRELVIITAVLSTGGILFLLAAPDLFTAIVGRDVTLSGRTNIWRFALEMAEARPVLGYGYGVFWLGPNSPGSRFWETTLQFELSAHNGYLQCLLDIGLVGLLTTLFAVFKPLLSIQMRSSRFKYGHSPESFSEWFLIFFLILNVAEIRLLDPTSVVTFVFAYISSSQVRRIMPAPKFRIHPAELPI